MMGSSSASVKSITLGDDDAALLPRAVFRADRAAERAVFLNSLLLPNRGRARTGLSGSSVKSMMSGSGLCLDILARASRCNEDVERGKRRRVGESQIFDRSVDEQVVTFVGRVVDCPGLSGKCVCCEEFPKVRMV